MAEGMAGRLTPITCRDDAAAAIKMSGLPVFLIGLGPVVFDLIRLIVAASEATSLPATGVPMIAGVGLAALGLA